MVRRFEESLKLIKKRILMLGEYTKTSLKLSREYIEEKAEDKLKRILKIEKESDLLNLEIQENCLNLIALFQPVARDLRFISAMMEISYFLERICDLSEGIANIIKKLKLDEDDTFYLQKMLDQVYEIIEVEMEALEKTSIDSLRIACQAKDDIIDLLDEEMRENLRKKISENPEKTQNLELILVSYFIERAGDLACKIASRILFMVEGERVHIK